MGIYIYMLTFCGVFLMSTHSQSSWPTSNGCHVNEKHEEKLIVANCLNTVFSPKHVSYDYYDYSNSGYCLTDYLSGTNYQLEVKYKFSHYYSDMSIPEFKAPSYGYSTCQESVNSLDLSENRFTHFPHLSAMNNLRKLTITKTNLTFTKFSNGNRLNALTDLDLSDNNVVSVTINDNEYPFENLKKLNLSHNYIVNLTDGIFNKLNKLELLDLSYNRIQTLSVLTFEGIKFLITLNISRNRISDINSSLIRFNLLENLDLSHNTLEYIGRSDFEKLIKLKTLDVSFNSLKGIEENLFQKSSKLQAISLNNNLLDSLGKNIFTNLNNLKNLDISQNKLKYLEKEIFRGLNISFFSVTGNNLEGSLQVGMFEGLGSVEIMDLSYQRIEAVMNFTFHGLDLLKQLLLNNNKIQNLSVDSFSALDNLIMLDLTNNRITCIDFTNNHLLSLQSLSLRNNILSIFDFENLHALQFLDLANNNITVIAPNSFYSLKDLINFDISNNPLTGSLLEKSFQGLRSLPSLDLFNTSLTVIKNDSFSSMVNLDKLNMSYGNINRLNFNALFNTGSITELDLSHNCLLTFDVNTTDLKYLKFLYLNHNSLDTISSHAFHGMSALIKLTLSYNNINMISDVTFYGQTSLSYLDLSYNRKLSFKGAAIKMNQNLSNLLLAGIDKSITFANAGKNVISNLDLSSLLINNITDLELSYLQNLTSLILSNNNAEILNTKCFNNVTNLQNLDVSYNKIKYTQPGTFKDNVRLSTLNVSHNFLTEVTYGIFRGLVNLKILDISYNYIKSLQSERFYEVKSLNFLIADHNQISYVGSEEFRGTSLSKLSIGENPLPCDILINFKKHGTTFAITAIKIDEIYGENIDGITCNTDKTYIEDKKPTYKYTRDEFPSVTSSNLSQNFDDLAIRDYSQYFINLITQIEFLKNSVNEYNDTKLLLHKIVKEVSVNDLSNKTKESIVLLDNNINYTNIYLKKIVDLLTVKKITWLPDSNVSETAINKTNRLLTKILEQVSSNNASGIFPVESRVKNESYATNLLLTKIINNLTSNKVDDNSYTSNSVLLTCLLCAIFAIFLVLIILLLFVLLKILRFNIWSVQRNSLIRYRMENSEENCGL